MNKVGAQAVVDVVGIVGDVVGNGGDLRLRAGEAPELEILMLLIKPDRPAECRARDSGRSGVPSRACERTVVLDQAFERLPGQVEAVEAGIAPLERGDDTQRLRVVIEAANVGEAAIERALAGMAERRMAEIVRKRQRLGKILVEAERAGERARDLGRLRAYGSAGCGNGRPRGRRRPGSCARAGGRPSNG